MSAPSSRDALRAAKAQLEEQQQEEEWQAVRSVAATLAALQAEVAALQAGEEPDADEEEGAAAAAPAGYGYAPSDDEEDDADAAASAPTHAEAAVSSGAGIRNRRTGVRHAHAPHSDATSAEQSARQHNPDLDFKGDEEEDEVSDEEEGTAPLMGGTAEAEAEAAAAAEEEEEEETEGDEPAGQSLAELRRSRAALLEVEKDDTRVVLGGVAGFFLATAVGAMLPFAGVQHDYVMASGMFSLLFFVLVMSFCPSCCSSRKPAEAGDISWVTVFMVCACIGTMIGGLIGSAVAFIH